MALLSQQKYFILFLLVNENRWSVKEVFYDYCVA